MRYFFFDDANVGHSTCGIASMTLMSIYRVHCKETSFNVDAWYDAIQVAPNVVVLGYLVEHMCIAAIARGAMGAVIQGLQKPLEKASFDDYPSVANMVLDGRRWRLFVPSTYYFANIDAAVLHMDHTKRMAHAYLIQVTIAKDHKDSENIFYENQWKRWEAKFREHNYKVDSTFVWINREEPTTQDVEPVSRRTRNAGKTITVQGRKSMRISVKALDLALHNAVETALFRLS